MRNWGWLLAVGLVGLGLLSFNAWGEGEGEAKGQEPGKPERRGLGGPWAPETLEKILTGELALTDEQRAKIKEAYAATFGAFLDKLAAAKKEGKAGKDLQPLLAGARPAFESYKAELLKILTEAQSKRLEEIRAAAKASREAAKPEPKKEGEAPPEEKK